MSSTWILEDGKPRRVSLLEWAIWLETAERQVAFTKLRLHAVSTVFLGLDMRIVSKGPPLIYETMVWNGGEPAEQWRYADRDTAMVGHQAAVRRYTLIEAEAEKLATALLTAP